MDVLSAEGLTAGAGGPMSTIERIHPARGGVKTLSHWTEMTPWEGAELVRRDVLGGEQTLPPVWLMDGSALGTGALSNPARRLVDDPVPRRSTGSYFIQLADLVAYASFRAVVPPGASIARVCPSDMWDSIGPATHTAVASLRPRSKPGIVLR